MARKQEVKPGKATILCKLNHEELKEYDIQITSIDYNPKNKIKNMVIRGNRRRAAGTDWGDRAGNERHPHPSGRQTGWRCNPMFFVNNPEKGFGIFAENMYENSKNIEAYEKAS